MAMPRKVLIYRLGSLGDTVVALPCFNLLARVFAGAERGLLTNVPADPRAPSPKALLRGSGLVDWFVEYPLGLRDPGRLASLRARIRRWAPQVLVYLAAPRGGPSLLRDLLFFKWCGIKRLVGLPYRRSLRTHPLRHDSDLYEHEAERLARCIARLGDARPTDPGSWDLGLKPAELDRARAWLSGLPHQRQIVACSVGTKVNVKDWGWRNWRELAERLSAARPGLSLVLLGAPEDFAPSTAVASAWRGPTLNVCGKLTVRESAAVLKMATMFLGQDSGPMHLAAAAGVPCVAVFSARNKPGVWYPYGNGHRVIYHRLPCFGCQLDECGKVGKRCIASIGVAEVLAAAEEVLEGCVADSRGDPGVETCRRSFL